MPSASTLNTHIRDNLNMLEREMQYVAAGPVALPMAGQGSSNTGMHVGVYENAAPSTMVGRVLYLEALGPGWYPYGVGYVSLTPASGSKTYLIRGQTFAGAQLNTLTTIITFAAVTFSGAEKIRIELKADACLYGPSANGQIGTSDGISGRMVHVSGV